MTELRLDRRAFVAGLATLAAAPALARAPAGRWAGVQAFMDGFVAKGPLPGVAAAIGRGTAPPDFLAAGTIAKDSRRAVDADTLWRIYSMTKPVTGMAAMMLVEDGRLKLDQNIADFIPGFANPRVLTDPERSLASRPARGPITVRHLLTHTAGLGYTIVTKGPLLEEYRRLGIAPAQVSKREAPGGLNDKPAPSLAVFADNLATLPLIADPGARWSYSVSLDLLGRVIELAAGMPFDRFLQRRLFDPLAMRSTGFQVARRDLPRLVTMYATLPDGAVVAIDPASDSIYAQRPPFPFGGAGLVSSARDYDRFLWMLAGEGAIGRRRVMRPETARLAMSNLAPTGADLSELGKDMGMGAGGSVRLVARDGRGVGAFDWGGAADTFAFVDRARGIRASGFAQMLMGGGFSGPFADAVYKSAA